MSIEKKILLAVFCVGFGLVAVAQSPIPLKSLQTAVNKPGTEGDNARQVGVTDGNGKQRYVAYTDVLVSPIGYTPAATGNTINLSRFVQRNDSIWYIDFEGDSKLLKVPGGGAVNDADWLKIRNNGVPYSITDSIYTLKTVSINGRNYFPDVELNVYDSTSTAGATVAAIGNRGGRFSGYNTVSGAWSSFGQEGSIAQVYGGAGTTHFSVSEVTGTSPGSPSGTFEQHFELDLVNNNAKFNKYPNSRNDAGLPVNVLTTSTTGGVESHPVADIIASIPTTYYTFTASEFVPSTPLAGWTQPTPTNGATASVMFKPGTVANYTANGSVWALTFTENINFSDPVYWGAIADGNETTLTGTNNSVAFQSALDFAATSGLVFRPRPGSYIAFGLNVASGVSINLEGVTMINPTVTGSVNASNIFNIIGQNTTTQTTVTAVNDITRSFTAASPPYVEEAYMLTVASTSGFSIGDDLFIMNPTTGVFIADFATIDSIGTNRLFLRSPVPFIFQIGTTVTKILPKKDINIFGGKFRGPSSGSSNNGGGGAGIFVKYGKNITVTNTDYKGLNSSAIWASKSSRLNVSNLNSNENRLFGIYVDSSKYAIFENLSIFNSGQGGFVSSQIGNFIVSDLSISASGMFNGSGDNVTISGGNAVSFSGGQISNSTCYAFSFFNCYIVSVDNMQFVNNNTGVFNVWAASSYLTVTNCVIEGKGAAFYFLNPAATMDFTTIQNCTFHATSTPPVAVGIGINGNNCIVKNNRILGYFQNIITNTSSNLVFNDNIVDGVFNNFSTATNNEICGNIGIDRGEQSCENEIWNWTATPDTNAYFLNKVAIGQNATPNKFVVTDNTNLSVAVIKNTNASGRSSDTWTLDVDNSAQGDNASAAGSFRALGALGSYMTLNGNGVLDIHPRSNVIYPYPLVVDGSAQFKTLTTPGLLTNSTVGEINSIALAPVGSTPNANGMSINASTFTLQPASSTYKGLIGLNQLKFPLKMTVVDGNTDVPGAGLQTYEVIRIPAAYNGYSISDVSYGVYKTGATGTAEMQIRRNGSGTAGVTWTAGQAVKDVTLTGVTVSTGDLIDVEIISNSMATPQQGLWVTIFLTPH